jgi:hypothetical protein
MLIHHERSTSYNFDLCVHGRKFNLDGDTTSDTTGYGGVGRLGAGRFKRGHSCDASLLGGRAR